MKIFEIATNSGYEARVIPINNTDFTTIKSGSEFDFNWKKLKGEVYKLVKKGNVEVLGMISLIEHNEEGTDAIEIELLEVGRKNRGKKKKLDNIAGCLIAYACRESIKRGHGGWVFLVPKTLLAEHYQQQYGFIPFGVCIASTDKNSLKLIKEYL